MTDESGQTYPFTPNTLLDNALGPLGYYGAFTANMHTDNATTLRGRRSCSPRRPPAACRSSPPKQMLTWLDGRNGSSFSAISCDREHVDVHGRPWEPAPTGSTGMVPTAGPAGRP